MPEDGRESSIGCRTRRIGCRTRKRIGCRMVRISYWKGRKMEEQVV